MCGIAGIFNQTSNQAVTEQDLLTMLRTMRHRGPDASGTWQEAQGVGIAHARLAIIDLRPESNQPFVSSDGNLVLTYNGEIFNYLELRQELEANGYRFRTKSDTEVLLTAYRHWGQDVCKRLNGMWAFAIYDRRQDLLFCSRDRFGIKPFYYALLRGRLLFASEVKALLALARELATIDADAVSKMLRGGIAAQTEHHFCRGVRRLPAGNNLIVKRGGTMLHRYWDYPSDIDCEISFDDACERFRELLVDSVRLRMRSDVPVGTTLSGGIDSSTLVCLMRTFYSGEHDAFTAMFGEGDYDESALAADLSGAIGLRHHSIESPTDDLITILERIVHHMDGPTQNPSTIPLWNIMKAMRGRIVVALEGQGADELLGGYNVYVPQAILDAVRGRRWQEAGRMARLLLAPARNPFYGTLRGGLQLARAMVPRAHPTWRRWRGDERVYAPILAHRPDGEADRDDAPRYPESLANALRRSHEGGLRTLLQYGDAISMAHSIESRLPFLDYRLVEFVFTLPGEYKIRDGRRKALLIEAARGHVPDKILDNPVKRGFVVPIREWFRDRPDDAVYPVLLDGRCRQRGLFDEKALRDALRRHVAGTVDLSNQIFRWLTLELWCRGTIDTR